VFCLVDGADSVDLDDVDVLGRQLVAKVVLDAVDVPHVADAVRHASHAGRHYAVVHFVLQPCRGAVSTPPLHCCAEVFSGVDLS